MSKQVDERVVSMQFDNKNFEKNVSTTMSTLDKFKQKLGFKGATKGLEDVNTAAKKVDMNNLGRGVDTVQAKFSAMQIVGTTALVNLTNSAMNAGKKIISALTIDPVKAGFQEYETQINAVQTILANTESKGSTIDDVNKALEDLNAYADQTIYNFTEMTRNIGTFTAAGVDLDTSTNAIKGIANLAAVSGSTSQQASTAMYQLSQAMSSGVVKLMDWNSVTNAGMGGQIFQDALKETARVHGVAIDDMIESEGSFRESLKNGWLTTDILTETLQKFTLATEGLTEEQIEANRQMLKSKGYTEKQIDEIFKLGNTATNAATKVKTFTQLWDVLKESAQSGWSQSWKIIIGDFEEAKELLTPLANFLTGIINKMSDVRNRILEAVLGNPFADFLKKLNDAGFGTIKKMIDGTNKLIGSLEYYQDVVNRVWRGDYNNRGDNPDRYDLLTGEGYNPRVVQELVNKGYKYKLTMDDVIAAQKKWGGENDVTAKSIEETAIALEDLTDEQLRNAGFTESEIKIFRMLAAEAKKTGKSIEEYMEEMGSMDGRTRLIETFKNVGTGLLNVFKAIGQAWSETFPVDETSLIFKLAMAIKRLYDWSVRFADGLQLVDEKTGKASKTIDEIKRTFKGLFAALDIVLTLVGGPIKIAFKILAQLLSVFNIDVWWLTANIGDAIVAFRDWIDKVLDFTAVFEKIKPYITAAIDAVKNWIETTKPLEKVGGFFSKMFEGIKKWVKSSEALQKVGDFFKNAFSGIGEWFAGIKDAENIPKYIIEGLVKGLSNGIKTVFNAVIAIGKGIIEKIKDILGIHSPSTEFIEIGKNIIAGLIVGIGSIKVLSLVSNITGAIGALAEPLEGIGSVLLGTGKVLRKSAVGIGRILKGAAKVVRKTAKVIGSVGNFINAKALQTVAISIAILAGSVAVLALLDPAKVWSAVGVIVVLAAVLGGLMVAINKFGMAGPKGIKSAISGVKAFAALAGAMIAISASMLLLAVSLRIMGGMDWGQFAIAATGIILFGAVLAGLIFVTKFAGPTLPLIAKTIKAVGTTMLLLAITAKILGGMKPDEFKVAAIGITLFGVIIAGLIIATKLAGPFAVTIGRTIKGIATAMLILAIVMKILGGMKWDKLGKAVIGMGLLTAVILALIYAVKLAGPGVAKVGATLLAISGAMLVLTIVAKMIAGMEWGEIAKAAVGLAGLVVIIRMMILAVQLAGPGVAKVGAVLLAVSTAMFLLTLVAKIIAGMSWNGIAKAAVGLAGLIVIIRMMIMAVQLAKNPVKIAGTLLAMSAAIGILAGITVLLSLVEVKALVKGITAVGFLAAFMTAMIWATRGASSCMQNLIVMTVAIGIMAAAVIALSFLEPTDLIGATLAMSMLMGMFAVMTVASKAAKGSFKSLILMVAVIGIIAGALYLLSILEIKSVLGVAASISALMLSFSVSCAIVSAIPVAMATSGALSLVAFIRILGTFIAALGGLSKIPGFNDLMSGGANVLGMIGAAIGSFIGELAGAIVEGVSKAIPVLGEMLAKFGEEIPPFIEAMRTVDLDVLAGAGYLAGAILALTVSEIIALIGSLGGLGFVALGRSLGDFGEEIKPFIDAMGKVKPEIVTTVGNLASAILKITAANILDGITRFITGGSSMGAFGEELATLGDGIVGFTQKLTDAKITNDAVGLASKAAQIITVLAEASAKLPNTGGLLADIVGDNDLGPWAKQMPIVAEGVAGFTKTLAEARINKTAVDLAKHAAGVITALATASAEIPNAGGALAELIGDNKFDEWSKQLPKVATGISGFVGKLDEFGLSSASVDTAKKAAEIITALATASAEIPNEGGFLAAIVGDNSILQWSVGLPNVAKGIAGFIQTLTEANLSSASVDTGKNAAEIIKSLAEASSKIPNTGGILGWLIGDNEVGVWSEDLPKVGEGIAGFISKIGTLKPDQITSVNTALDVVVAMANTVTPAADSAGNIEKFGSNVAKLGMYMAKFIDWMIKISQTDINASVQKVNTIIEMTKNVAGQDSKACKTFGTSLEKLGKDGINGFIKALTGTKSISDVEKSVEKLVNKFIDGFKDKNKDIKNAMDAVASEAASKIATKANKGAFTSAGKDLISGLVIGLQDKAKKQAVYNAAYQLGQTAVQGEKDGQDSHSPSKLTIKAGKWIGEGLIIGMQKMLDPVYNTGDRLGETASNSISSAISQVYDLMNSEMDAQPTIRPVLDLSEVKAGANSIAGMFSGNRTLAISAPGIGAVSASMSSRQNGNNDLISAINKLAKSNSKSGDTYQINGISYSEGSEVADAISTLVRAVKMEGRT